MLFLAISFGVPPLPPRFSRPGYTGTQPSPNGKHHDRRPSSEQFALAARALATRGTGPRLRGQALPARPENHAGTRFAESRPSPGQVARDHRWRAHRRRIGRHHRVPDRALRQWPIDTGSGHAGEAALDLLAAFRGRLGHAAVADETGVRQGRIVAHAVFRQADRARHRQQGQEQLHPAEYPQPAGLYGSGTGEHQMVCR